MPKHQTIFIFLLLIISLFFTACFGEEKVVKPSKVLLEGTPNVESHKLAEKYFSEGEYEKALTFYLQQLEEDLKYYHDDSLEIALDYNDIGLVYDELKNYKKALYYYDKTMKIDEVRLESNSTERAITYFNVASVYDALKEYHQAISYYEKALAIDEVALPSNDEELLAYYEVLSEAYEDVSEINLSVKYLKKALIFKEQVYGIDDERTRETRAELEEKEKKIKIDA